MKKTLSYSELIKKVAGLEKALEARDRKIEKITSTDILTGCYNWRYFLTSSDRELNFCHLHHTASSFIGVDIDHFRQINEIYGVKVADVLIKKLTDLIKINLRKSDILTRWRGDEFFIVLPNINNDQARRLADKIRKKISGYKFKYRDLVLTVKASLGVVSSSQNGIFSAKDVVSALNICFIQAKRGGGDVIVLYSSQKPARIPKKEKKAGVRKLKSKLEKMNTLLTRDLLEMIYGFARTIEVNDSYTGEHVEYTARIAEKIAKKMRLPKKEIDNIRHSAILHDLGKIGIDKKILSKEGKLNSQECEVIKMHPSIGAEILRGIHLLHGAIPAILHHHERFDGGGYPLGLKGREIPLNARIVAIADVYQALVSDRPYRKGFPKNKALEIIKKESGKHFDPAIVKIFLKIIDEINEQG